MSEDRTTDEDKATLLERLSLVETQLRLNEERLATVSPPHSPPLRVRHDEGAPEMTITKGGLTLAGGRSKKIEVRVRRRKVATVSEKQGVLVVNLT